MKRLWPRFRKSLSHAHGWVWIASLLLGSSSLRPSLSRLRFEAEYENFSKGLLVAGVSATLSESVQEDFFAATLEASALYGIDPELLAAVAIAESELNPEAQSGKGALGLFQILPTTASVLWPRFLKSLPSEDPLKQVDPLQSLNQVRLSVLLGAFYLAELRDSFGNWDLALASYNQGPGRILKALRAGEFKGRAYIQKIRDLQNTLEQSLPEKIRVSG